MSPTAVTEPASAVETIKANLAKVSLVSPDNVDLTTYSSFNSTPSIGTEFPAESKGGKPVLDIRDVLADQAKLKALGRLVSERGVVFFRNAQISPEEQITLVDSLGKHGGKPASSSLHIHPCTLPNSRFGDEISLISNQVVFDKAFKRPAPTVLERPVASRGWHSDITFESVPSDYASLVIRTEPDIGGDTLWASAYEAYDRLSPAYQKFLEGLTALHKGVGFLDLAKRANISPLRENRGSPENVGQDLETVHPVIRTNPVTGWKGVFVNRGFTQRIVELSKPESDKVLEFLYTTISANHDLQVRFRWEKDSLAIWDNRSSFHTATEDLEHGVLREGTRSVSIGERPYLDPASTGRREALARQK